MEVKNREVEVVTLEEFVALSSLELLELRTHFRHPYLKRLTERDLTLQSLVAAV